MLKEFEDVLSHRLAGQYDLNVSYQTSHETLMSLLVGNLSYTPSFIGSSTSKMLGCPRHESTSRYVGESLHQLKTIIPCAHNYINS